ncbi:MAG: DUF1800 domain-containing protein [SAR202 cluster bacterium]|jgi:uncharacterized protein (DUF1800 family)|nr:DUF1800 domain-containing protein [SAR202 cluster bacterium]
MGLRDTKLMAHLLRRAGFGATHIELEDYLQKGYEATVESLLYPTDSDHMPEDIIRRYHVDQSELRQYDAAAANWMYRMITSKSPLEEKIALFWHSLFATGYSKLNQARSLLNQIDMFRQNGLGRFDTLLLELSRDPAMIIWLDNDQNHRDAINENYGRELLELFSMGIGNYTEEDIKECARAFTGWTLGNVEYMAMRASKDSIWPYGRIAWHFGYRPEDHDDGEKTFLGETGNFNGEDIIDIISKNDASARFVATRLFQFFAADEIDDEGEKVVEKMMESYFESGYEIRSIIRTLFNSDYFKSGKARYARVKCPVEQVIGTIRLAGSYQKPDLGVNEVASQAFYMGQGLLIPPTVEGWHEGAEWIDSGALVERVNFAANELRKTKESGVRSIIDRMSVQNGHALTPNEIVDLSLDLLGSVDVGENTRTALVQHVREKGDVDLRNTSPGDESERRVGELLSLIASSPEFQMA